MEILDVLIYSNFIPGIFGFEIYFPSQLYTMTPYVTSTKAKYFGDYITRETESLTSNI